MTLAYWLLGAAVVWCYVGYPAFVALQARFRPRPVRIDARLTQPSVVVVVAVRNEATLIARRIENLLGQDYPADRLDVLVVCNGTTDGTDAVVEAIARGTSRVRLVRSAAKAGKAGALNIGIAEAHAAEVIVFADARQTFARSAVRELVAPLSDPAVGAVTGRLVVERAPHAAVEGMRLYWGMESRLRAWESRSGSVVGATGAIYAVRRALATTIPPGLILDDVYLPLTIGMQGKRIVMAEDALAFDTAANDQSAEFLRKRRTMVGNIQLLTTTRGLLSPARNPLFARYVSHKLLRVLTPFCLVAMLGLSASLGGRLYGSMFFAQLGIYVLGTAGLFVRIPRMSFASAFVLIHLAIFAAVSRWRQDASDVWIPAATPASPPPASASPLMGEGATSHG